MNKLNRFLIKTKLYVNIFYISFLSFLCFECFYDVIKNFNVPSLVVGIFISLVVYMSSKELSKDIKKRLELRKVGSKICDQCYGEKIIWRKGSKKIPLANRPILRKIKIRWSEIDICPKCRGTGRLDWVQYMRGRVLK